jgi:hypothetical protein
MSTSKFVDARYTIVYNDKEVNYYEKATTKITVSEDAVLLGATNARGVARERRGNLRGGCMSKLCVE